MKYIFLSDAHLRDPDDQNYRKLLAFLQSLEKENCSLFLLGDIFHFWVGYRHSVFSPYVSFLEQLKRLRCNNIKIVFVEGNHDFHMGNYFEKTLGCRVVPNNATLDLSGRRVFITHGDLMDENDRFYRLLRKILRSAAVFRIIRFIHPDWTWGIAQWASRKSHKVRIIRQKSWDPETMLRKHASLRFAEGHDAVVTGHIHIPLHKETDQGSIISLGDWISQFSYAVLEDGRFSMKTFEDNI